MSRSGGDSPLYEVDGLTPRDRYIRDAAEYYIARRWLSERLSDTEYRVAATVTLREVFNVSINDPDLHITELYAILYMSENRSDTPLGVVHKGLSARYSLTDVLIGMGVKAAAAVGGMKQLTRAEFPWDTDYKKERSESLPASVISREEAEALFPRVKPAPSTEQQKDQTVQRTRKLNRAFELK